MGWASGTVSPTGYHRESARAGLTLTSSGSEGSSTLICNVSFHTGLRLRWITFVFTCNA
jgi:hypothetical protein